MPDTDNPPTYRPLKDDGATFKCRNCGCQEQAKNMWYLTTPAGVYGCCCITCVDEDWLLRATYNPEPI